MNGVWWSRLLGDNWPNIGTIPDASPISGLSFTHNQAFASDSENGDVAAMLGSGIAFKPKFHVSLTLSWMNH